MQIAPIEEKHFPQIVRLWREFMEFHFDLDPHFTLSENSDEEYNKLMHDSIKKDTMKGFMAIERDEILGYCFCMIKELPLVFKYNKYGFIADMAVKAEHRRKGIGELLLNEALKWFEKKGMKRIELFVHNKNQMGVSFWEKHGFKEYLKAMQIEI